MLLNLFLFIYYFVSFLFGRQSDRELLELLVQAPDSHMEFWEHSSQNQSTPWGRTLALTELSKGGHLAGSIPDAPTEHLCALGESVSACGLDCPRCSAQGDVSLRTRAWTRLRKAPILQKATVSITNRRA